MNKEAIELVNERIEMVERLLHMIDIRKPEEITAAMVEWISNTAIEIVVLYKVRNALAMGTWE